MNCVADINVADVLAKLAAGEQPSDDSEKNMWIMRHVAQVFAAVQKDAMRYRWLRENGDEAIGDDRGCGPEWTYGGDLDDLVDSRVNV